MPKIVDHTKRKQLIAQATWKVISEQGIHHATSRTIASEAGLSQGALRHYFSKQEGLLTFAMELVKEQLVTRLIKLDNKQMEPKDKVVEYLLEFIPTDKQTLLEMEVWFAFITYGKTEKGFTVNNEELEKAIKAAIVFLKNESLLKDVDEEKEKEKLYAFINGLALNLYLEPHLVNREQSKEIIKDYLKYIMN
ncbi:TetR/AcrR family transcriptional regulator [Alkalicoccobacillus porphyridii]|uniref:TetR family transcriptional regulator n=1 Tax=Alkalicoccobacillus porphyridii TaxID=2597270 RepID=A0A554A169_9BACI|nr:TetR family transcriptional regulator C-terminal domain-containing protein [Alkalicoccobacillus porphyridii]TSB47433.1 TetR family transcriptional regulator [Alkalicoccobacillus porphyridii]